LEGVAFILSKNKAMRKFTIIPISAAEAEEIRSTRVDHFGNTVLEQVATGSGPCRVSLRAFVAGKDKRLLFSHSPFTIANAFNQCGPVFISADAVEPYSDVHRFPPEIKANKKSFPLNLVGYTATQMMAHTRLVGDADVEELIEEIFATHPEVDYLHARNAQAQCFICRIERRP
jgi:hypothetical protein